MTAIVVVHTPDGYVIGADGRQIDSKTGIIESDKAQKIFSFESETVRLAYAWTGSTELYAEDQTCIYDLGRATERILPSVELFGRSSWAEFISRFCDGLKTQLPACIENPPKELAKIILVGFFRGVSCQAEVRVLYPNSFFQPQVRIQSPSGHAMRVFAGAESTYSRYQLLRPQNNAEAVRFVREYILDCIESREEDCQAIGGHLHIATVTPSGFLWTIPPLG